MLVKVDLSFNRMESLPVPTVLSMNNLKYLNLLGNPFPAPLNYLTQGSIPVDTMFFLKSVDRFLLLFEAVSGEIDENSRPRLEDLLRRHFFATTHDRVTLWLTKRLRRPEELIKKAATA